MVTRMSAGPSTPPAGTGEVAIIGGTGKLGMALATRLVASGHRVVLGSRSQQRAHEAADGIASRLPDEASSRVRGAENSAAIRGGGVIVVAVPYEGMAETLGALTQPVAGRVVVSTAVPVEFVKGSGPRHVAVSEGSAAELVSALMPGARVVGALQTVSHVTLNDLAAEVHGDVILTADDQAAKAEVAALLGSLAGARIVDGGPLRNSVHVEHITVLLLAINARVRRSTGVRIANLPDDLAGVRMAS
jgi:NADPH-dependent F420 reductase